MKYTLTEPEAPSQKYIQYYEVHGNRGIYKDGWKAVVNHCFVEDYEKDEWELYHVDEDYSEKYNVAAQYPEKLQELKEDFMHEAGKYGVFPMLRFSMHAKPENLSRQYRDKIQVQPARHVFKNVIKPVNLIGSKTIGGSIGNKANQSVAAYIHRDDISEEGVIYSSGQRFGGFSFYIKDNHLKYVYNANKFNYFTAVSKDELPVGDIRVAYIYKYHEDGDYATVELFVNDEPAGETKITRFCYMTGFTVSLLANPYSPVTEDYKEPFEFTGKADKIILEQYATEIDAKEVLAKLSNIE
jgi:arylsulfatase